MSTSNAVLTQAFNQWSERPADERFSSLEAMHAHVSRLWAETASSQVNIRDITVEVQNDEPVIVGPKGTPVGLSNHSFGQLAKRVGAPAGYLRTLPANLTADILNTEIARTDRGSDDTLLLLRKGANWLLRAINTETYDEARIVNRDITSRLIDLKQAGWFEAPAAFDGSRGQYAGDRDMFSFMVDDSRRIFETLPGGGLSRGFFVSNSEIGNSRSFRLTQFLYEYVCGNHRVWGAKNVAEIVIPHRGADATRKAFRGVEVELRKYANAPEGDDVSRIEAARKFVFGATKDQVLDAVFALRVPGLTQKLITTGYDRAVEKADLYGSPNTAWGFTGGLTEIGRDAANADERDVIDRAAGKVLEKITL